MGIFGLFNRKKKQAAEPEITKQTETLGSDLPPVQKPVEEKNEGPVIKAEPDGNCRILFFSADWCSHSRRQKQMFNDEEVYIPIEEINVDKDDSLTVKYAINAVPTMIVVNADGTEVCRWSGTAEVSEMNDFLKRKAICACTEGQSLSLEDECTRDSWQKSETEKDREDREARHKLEEMLEGIFGTPETPVKVEKVQLSDGSIYTGEAYVGKDGYYYPHGFGKRTCNDDHEVIFSGWYEHGCLNGACYMNMHFAMIMGRFVKDKPDGWVLSLEHGVLFGVWNGDDYVEALSGDVMWIQDEWPDYKGLPVGVYPKRGTVMFGQPYKAENGVVLRKAIGMQFTNEGDVYVGTDDKGLSKTGYFVKYCHDGYVRIGHFTDGMMDEEMTFQELLSHYPLANNAKNRALRIDTTRKYF